MDEVIVNYAISVVNQNPWLFNLGHFLGIWFSLFVLIFYFVILVRGKEILHFKRPMFFSIATVFATYFATSLLKNVFERVRPIDLPFETVSVFSFPSGHSSVFFVLALLASLLLPKGYGWFFFIVALVISISRVLIGVHFPSDVLEGWGVAVIVFCILWTIWWIFSKKKRV